MIFDDEPRQPPTSEVRTIAIAVVSAALTSLATGLVTMFLDEMKERRKGATGQSAEDSK
jgi:hypothetical protein